MGKEFITIRQGISIMVLFIMGSSLVLGTGSEANQDAWIAVLLGLLFAFLIAIIYTRILTLFPEKDLFEILRIIFGNIFGKIIALLLIWYAFHLGALVLRNFSEFMALAGLPETPGLIPAVVLIFLCIWVVKEGIEVLGKWSQFVLPVLLSIILAVIILSITLFNYENIQPIMFNNINPVLEASFSCFSFPFAETVVFMMLGNSFKGKKSVMKVYMVALLIGGMTVVIITLRNLLIMGPEFVSRTLFPSYAAVSLVNIGDFVQRMEIIVSVVFLFAGFTKISICLLSASKGIAFILNIEDYRRLVVPIALLMMNLSFILYTNITQMQEWAFKIYKFYAFPFQVLLPLFIWVFAEIKAKKGVKSRVV